MIYNDNEKSDYQIKLYKDVKRNLTPVLEYIRNLAEKDRAKVAKYIKYLKENKGILDEPYSKHIRGKIRELRVDFAKNKHRIFYFTFVGKNIILLHAFLKKTAKTPESEIKRAEENYNNIMSYK
jgi:phage-related protein